jgi:hypothetical protein
VGICRRLSLLRDGVAQPIHTLVDTVSRRRDGALDVPLAVPKGVQLQLIGNLDCGFDCVEQW